MCSPVKPLFSEKLSYMTINGDTTWTAGVYAEWSVEAGEVRTMQA